MIDAHAVLARLETLREAALEGVAENAGSSATGAQAFEAALQDVTAEHITDGAGNQWLSLAGRNPRTVLLGTYQEGGGRGQLDSRLGLVTGLETLKALAKRYPEGLPCTVAMVIWAGSGQGSRQDSGEGSTTVPGPALGDAAAYLELHIEPHAELQRAGTPLGVVTAAPGITFNARLQALCDEAIRELTGTSGTLETEQSFKAVDLAKAGVPAAMMFVQAVPEAADEKVSDATRLHILQAAESFGRWAEAAMHLVAGDPVDLWAREHRIPQS